jgi:hypothetical protein
MGDPVSYLQQDWKSLFDDSRHPYLAQLPPAAVAAFVAGGATGSNGYAAAAAAGAAGYYAFAAQNAFGYTTLDLVHTLAGGDLEKFRTYNALAGGVASVLAAYVANRLGDPYHQALSTSSGVALGAAVAAAEYLTSIVGDSASNE